MNKDLKIKHETIKLLEDNYGNKLQNIDVDKEYLNMMTKQHRQEIQN